MTKLAFIDVETTGGKASFDRITEVAICVVENDKEVEIWQSLVNPGRSIPAFIQQLTGIDDRMVANAPRFEELAERIYQLTKGCIFVAHNARFDYAFFKSEFRRISRAYKRRTLCTVKLAKQLYPEHRRHGMDSLIERHGIETRTRHRAMADVEAMLAFYRIAKVEHEGVFLQALEKQLGRPSLPQEIDPQIIDELPESPGVYRFYGENRSLLYVGKSINLHNRVLSHFAADHRSEKEMILSRSTRQIEWDQTAGELGALLLEIKQIQSLHPLYNRRSRASEALFTFVLGENDDGYLECRLEALECSSGVARALGLYKTQAAAKRALKKISSNNELCLKLLGLESPDGACFGHQVGTCRGACLSLEDRELYNLRVNIAFHASKLLKWPYQGPMLIKEVNHELPEARSREQVFVVDQWCVIGMAERENELADLLAECSGRYPFDPGVYQILKQYLRKPQHQRNIHRPGLCRSEHP